MTLLDLLLQTPQTEVEDVLRWLRVPPAWVITLVILPLLVGYVLFFYRRENPTGRPFWRPILATLRVAVMVLGLAMLAQPVMQRSTFETRDSTVPILIDDSLSMDIPDRFSDRETLEKLAAFLGLDMTDVEETSRYDLVRRLFADENKRFVDKLREKGKVSISTFARAVRDVENLEKLGSKSAQNAADEGAAQDDGAGLDLLPPYSLLRGDARVRETRIGEALRDKVAAVRGAGYGAQGPEEEISAILLITDGQENAGSVSSLDLARRLGERGTPIHIIGVGNPDDPKDLRLVHVDSGDVVLVDDRVPFDATLEADGFEGERVRVNLRVESEVVDSKYVDILGGGKRQTVRLQFRPRKKGEFTVEVEVDKVGGEVFDDNNSITKTIRVLDQKIKVLYLEKLPRWEYRYLKNALTRDPTVEAQIFLYSADPAFVQESSPDVPSLLRVPADRSELFKYHVILLGDVGVEELGPERVALLKTFVDEGGGVVFVSGPHTNPSKYRHTELYDILPVEVAESDPFSPGGHQEPVTGGFNVKLESYGETHPVMRLDNDSARNKQLWENEDGSFYDHLPPFYWYAKVGREKEGLTKVLARHPTDIIDPIHQRRRVIFAYMNYGKGLTFFSAVDNTWRWRAGVDSFYFARFWGQVVRFVATGRFLQNTPRFSIAVDKTSYNIGETVRIDAKVFDVNMRPSDDETVTVYHREPGREGEPPERIELRGFNVAGGVGGPKGEYQGTLSAGVRGRHEVWLGSESEQLSFKTFTVEVPALESRDPRLNRAFLERLARASGGEYFELHEALQAVEKIKGTTRQQGGIVENDDLWDEWWVVVLFTTLISVEWILRKWVRLL